jgi:hypothetical protein
MRMSTTATSGLWARALAQLVLAVAGLADDVEARVGE